jgi:hypothetical protein
MGDARGGAGRPRRGDRRAASRRCAARCRAGRRRRGFATPPIAGKRAALLPAAASLAITDAEGRLSATFALHGTTPAAGAQWLSAQLGKPVAAGAGGPFQLGDAAALEDVTRSYANAVRALLCVRDMVKSEEPVRVAAEPLQVTLGVAFGGGDGVGLGYAPGDAELRTPYFYGKPCPLPEHDADALPELEGGGEWKTDGAWFGGVLRRAEWIWYDAEQLQAGAAVSFLDSCVDAARVLFAK